MPRSRLACSIFLMVIVSACLAGCTTSTTVTAKGHKIVVVQHSEILSVAPGQTAAGTVSCASGEVLVSGGYFTTAVQDTLAATQAGNSQGVRSDYPSDSSGAPPDTQGQAEDSWTVSANNATAAEIEYQISANCVTGFPISTHVWYQPFVQDGILGYDALVHCPTANALTGGGYQDVAGGINGADGVIDQGVGSENWAMNSIDGGVAAFAVCATGVYEAPPVWSFFDALSQLGPDHYEGEVAVACAGDEVLVGGGFIDASISMWPLSNDVMTLGDPTQWHVGFNNTNTQGTSGTVNELGFNGVEGICVRTEPVVAITFSNYHHLIRIPADNVIVASDGSGEVKASKVTVRISQAQSGPIAAVKTTNPFTGGVSYGVPVSCGDPTPASNAATAALKIALSGKVAAGQVAFGSPVVTIDRGSLTCLPAAGTSRTAPFTYVQAIDGSATQSSYTPLDVSTYQYDLLQQTAKGFGTQYVLRETQICPQGPQLISATSTRATVACMAYGVVEWQWTTDALRTLAQSLVGKSRDAALHLLNSTPGIDAGSAVIDLSQGDTLPGDASKITIIVVRPQDTAPIFRAP